MTYADYYNFDQRYFEGREVADPHPAGYYYYPQEPLEYSQYAAQLSLLHQNSKLLTVGCGYGFFLQYCLHEHGYDNVYGMDISPWVQQAAFGDVSDRIYQGDVLNSQDIQDIQQATPGRAFNIIYSEYLLEHLTDEEAIAACQNMRDAAQNLVVHRVWSGTGADFESQWFNPKTIDEWVALVGDNPNEEWIDYDDPNASTI